MPLALLLSLFVARANGQGHPKAMLALCKGKENIITWSEIPHDWQSKEQSSLWRGDGAVPPRYMGKDWWYWKNDWKQKIADGDVDQEPRLNEEFSHKQAGGALIGRMNGPLRTVKDVVTTSECRQVCAFEYSTQNDLREKCQWFSYEPSSKECQLFSRWSGMSDTNPNGVDLDDEACYGTEARSDSCSWGAAQVWKTYRIVDIYPAGFQSFSLREFNEPPLCIHVPQSSDKKVEVMIETEMNDSRVCIMDGRDMGVSTNDVGNVRTCDNGQLYSCFTAATKKENESWDSEDNDDFYFYISCEGSCEASDVDLWIRLRKSERSWDEGKKDWASDIEYWCEGERSTEAGEKDKPNKSHKEFTYPSELLPAQPNKYPYRITQGMGPSSAGSVSTLVACIVGLFVALQLLQ